MNNTEATQTNEPATVAQQGAHGAPKKASSKKGASPKKGAPKGKTAAKGGKSKAPASKNASKAAAKTARAKVTTPRAESKGAKILELIRRSKGATLAEIMETTSWQAHSVRGFLSTAAKKYSVTIASEKNGKGERVYRIS